MGYIKHFFLLLVLTYFILANSYALESQDIQTSTVSNTEKPDKEKIQKETSKIYSNALVLYRKKRLTEALAEFNKVQGLMPGYSQTEFYLNKIPKDIAKSQEEAAKLELRQKVDKLYQEGIKAYTKGDYEVADTAFKQVLLLDPNHKTAKKYAQTYIPNKQNAKEKGEVKKVQEANKEVEKELQKVKTQQAENLYNDGVKLFKNKQYKESYELFLKLKESFPDYKKADYYIRILPEKIAQQKKDLEKKQNLERIAQLCKEGKELFKNDQFEQAEAKFKEILSIDAYHETALNYINVKIPQKKKNCTVKKEGDKDVYKYDLARVRRIADKIDKLNKTETNKKAENLYKDALSSYNKKNYAKAYDTFKKVEGVLPDYKKTREYINKIPGQIAKEGTKPEDKKLKAKAQKKLEEIEKNLKNKQ